MFTGLILLGLIIYIIHLGSRITKLERLLGSNPAAKVVAPKANPISPSRVSPAMAPTTKAAMPATAVVPAQHLDSKSFINALPKIGILALIFGLAFFLKYAIDQGWISIYLRLGLGAVVGTLFLILYYLWKDKYPKYSLALAGGGLAIWYLTTFAAVRMYDVISINGGMVVLAIVTIVGVLLAYKTKSESLSALAWGGAYLAPILLGVGNQSYSLLLIYLTVVSFALLMTIYYHKNKTFFGLVVVGTGLNLLWIAFDGSLPSNYYLNTLLFLVVHILMNSVIISALIKTAPLPIADNDQKEFGVLYGLVFIVFGIPLALIAYNQYRDYASLIMLAFGAWTFLIYALHDRIEMTSLNFLLSGLGSFMLTIALMWQFTGNTQVIMLYLLGLVGIIVGRIQKRFELRSWGLLIVMVGIIAAIMISYVGEPALLFSEKFGLEILGIAALVVSYFLYSEDQLTEFEHNIHTALLYIIAVLLWFFVSWDLINFYGSFGDENIRNLSISIWWLVYAVILMIGSLAPILRPLRKIALLLFGLVIIKVFLYDVASLEILYRIVSFISLGVILLAVSFAYQHNKEKIKQYLE